MTRALIVYMSLGGTTSRVARHIAQGLEQAGVETHLHNLALPVGDPGGPPDLLVEECDLIGVGAPTHYYRAPRPVRDFLRRLPRLDGRPGFTFALHGTYPGRTHRDLRTGLEERGVRHLATFSGHGADRYVAYLRKGFLFAAGHPDETELAAALGFGRAVAGLVADDGSDNTSDDAAATRAGLAEAEAEAERDVGWFCRLERALTGPTLAHHVYSRLFRVDRDRCTGCGSCRRRCPQGNITLDHEGRPTFGRDCLLCLYCEMVCPEEAIASPVGWPPFDAFVRHNVRAAAADPHIDHAPVTHERGRTRLLGTEKDA